MGKGLTRLTGVDEPCTLGVRDLQDYFSIVEDIKDEECINVNMIAVLYKNSKFENVGLNTINILLEYISPKEDYHYKDTTYVIKRDTDFIDTMKSELGEGDYFKRLDYLAKEYTLKTVRKINDKTVLASAYMIGRVWIHRLANMAMANGIDGDEYTNWMSKYGNIFKDGLLKSEWGKPKEQGEIVVNKIFDGYKIT